MLHLFVVMALVAVTSEANQMDATWTADDVNKNLDKMLDLEKLVFWPNSVLNKKCDPVDLTKRQELLDLVSLMQKVMGSAEGIGIAAPQIGVMKQVICISVDETHLNVGNPTITPVGTETVLSQEGCLSFPAVYVKVKRFKEVVLTGYELEDAENRFGNLVSWSLTGKAAICAQHETDHINGITMVDHLSKLKRDIIRDKIKKMMRK